MTCRRFLAIVLILLPTLWACAQPAIREFSPQSGATGAVITIRGSHFSGVTAVKFGGIPAAGFSLISDSTITATVGNGSSGKVVVITSAGTDSIAGFTYTTGAPSTPKINSYSPTVAATGDTVIIKGHYFTGATEVSFEGTPAAQFSVSSDSVIVSRVGGGSSGRVSVKTPLGVDSLKGFTYNTITSPARIYFFSPGSGTTGDIITIKGSKFIGMVTVKFGGVTATSVTSVGDTILLAKIGTGSSGWVHVHVPAGPDSLAGFTFIPPQAAAPKIKSFSPTTASTGGFVTIKGSGFTSTTAVTFGAVNAAGFTVNSDSSITAALSAGGNSGSVGVVTPAGSDALAGFTFVPTVPLPEITLADTARNLFNFTAVAGNFSGVKYFIAGGKNLQGDITISAPKHFQVSKSSGSGFGSSVALGRNQGITDTTRVYLRFKSDTVGTYNETVLISCSNTPNKSVVVTGTATAPPCDTIKAPLINGLLQDSTICTRDSLILTASGSASGLYKWSTGDTARTIVIKTTATVTVQALSGTSCSSPPSAIVKVIRNINPIPSIALVNDSVLISSPAPKYRWYFNNTILKDTLGSLPAKKVGLYAVETSNDKICWDRSVDFPVVLLPVSLLFHDSLVVKSYPNPTSTGQFTIVATLQHPTNVVARLTVTNSSGAVLLQTNKFIFFGKEIRIPVTLNVKGTVFAKLEINNEIKTQTVILQ
jgi:hypothetical protein